jgi:hypothetical protein
MRKGNSMKRLLLVGSAYGMVLAVLSMGQAPVLAESVAGGTTIALVPLQAKKDETLGISSASCTRDSSDPNKVNFTWTVSWMNQTKQFTATVAVEAQWTTSDGTLLGATMDLPSTNIVGGGHAKPTSDITGTGSVTPPATPANVGGVIFKVTLKNALEKKKEVPVDPASATTDFCRFGS